MSKTRVMLVDDHAVVRAGLKALLDGQADLEVVAEAGTAADAAALARDRRPDVLVLDLNLPGGGSLPLAEQLAGSLGGPKILILSMHDDPAYVRAALAAGATGYVVKTVREQDLLAAVRAVRLGQLVVNLGDEAKTAAVFGYLGPPKGPRAAAAAHLSDREAAVLNLLGRGHTNQEVADLLELSPKTVATYRARIGEKLGLRTTAEFVKFVTATGSPDRPDRPG